MSVANKGSQYQMQQSSTKQLIEKALEDIKLQWFSPIEEDNYKEYQLNGKPMMEALNLPSDVNETFNNFWPKRQPQWDGIALGEDDKLYLFEAKSHLQEIKPANDGKSEENTQRKQKSILDVAEHTYNVNMDETHKDMWFHQYYQIANRLTFAKEMKEFISPQTAYKDVVLVFVNFYNDKTWEKDGKMVHNAETWDNKYDEILQEMGISWEDLRVNNVFVKNIDVDSNK